MAAAVGGRDACELQHPLSTRACMRWAKVVGVRREWRGGCEARKRDWREGCE